MKAGSPKPPLPSNAGSPSHNIAKSPFIRVSQVWSLQQFGKAHGTERQPCLMESKVLQAAEIKHQRSTLLIRQLLYFVHSATYNQKLSSLPYGST